MDFNSLFKLLKIFGDIEIEDYSVFFNGLKIVQIIWIKYGAILKNNTGNWPKYTDTGLFIR